MSIKPPLPGRDSRRSYCAARLQTLDQGAPVSTYTVWRELGHESEAIVGGSTRTSARSPPMDNTTDNMSLPRGTVGTSRGECAPRR